MRGMMKGPRTPRVDIKAEAIKHGCAPEWSDGILGWAWHCTCPDNLHGVDQQCSYIDAASCRRRRKAA